jgi:hypothetical protein
MDIAFDGISSLDIAYLSGKVCRHAEPRTQTLKGACLPLVVPSTSSAERATAKLDVVDRAHQARAIVEYRTRAPQAFSGANDHAAESASSR